MNISSGWGGGNIDGQPIYILILPHPLHSFDRIKLSNKNLKKISKKNLSLYS